MNSEHGAISGSGTDAAEDKYFYNEEHGLPVIMHLFDQHFGKKILEVGAGTGAVAKYLVDSGLSVTAVEPEESLARRIRNLIPQSDNFRLVEGDSQTAYAQFMTEGQKFDAIIYVSVLEHIFDDQGEFKSAEASLNVGGKLLIFVPALEFLFARIDAETGHFRRYTKSRLAHLTAEAGLKIVSLKYFETVGIIPYLVIYKLLRRRDITKSSTGVYNNLVLPLSMIFYRLSRGRLLGKNLVLVAQKT